MKVFVEEISHGINNLAEVSIKIELDRSKNNFVALSK